MPENDRKLTLHSPAGSEHAVYRWPLTRSVSTPFEASWEGFRVVQVTCYLLLLLGWQGESGCMFPRALGNHGRSVAWKL